MRAKITNVFFKKCSIQGFFCTCRPLKKQNEEETMGEYCQIKLASSLSRLSPHFKIQKHKMCENLEIKQNSASFSSSFPSKNFPSCQREHKRADRHGKRVNRYSQAGTNKMGEYWRQPMPKRTQRDRIFSERRHFRERHQNAAENILRTQIEKKPLCFSFLGIACISNLYSTRRKYFLVSYSF